MPQTSSSQRRVNEVVVQLVIGVASFIAWLVIDGLAVPDASFTEGSITVLPLFVAYVLGVMSRFIPGVGWLAKRLG